MSNSTMVTEFLLISFADTWKIRVLYSMLFLFIYLATLLGNLLIVTVTTFDQKLNTPLYFFLRNLSILDVCYITVTVPNACVYFLTGNRTISLAACATQVFLVIYFAYVEILFLTVMAQDRYMAICQPLHYTIIMNNKVCIQMTLVSLLSGLVYSGVHTGKTFQLTFCRSNVIHQFFCDVPSLLRISCSDTSSNFTLLLVSIIVVGGICFIFITVSYINIFRTMLKFSIKEQGKAFSTCVPHIFVLTVFLSSIISVYLRPSVTSETINDMILSAFYTMVPPFLNPIIYSLRNTQIKEAVRRVIF
ncbi:olfactory receptor 14C36-like [Sus scrofa]|uniref:G-protein coupled receptors family 1 profile domain-containing protein n=2 Tax=Sus scrofa TaxID=9823 RepID=A0A8W4FMT2_PIG|nr:olfactory receptor 14C36-like [Sus scrofa]